MKFKENKLKVASGELKITSLSSLVVLILVGGLGTRLQSVVNDRPKAMAPVSGRPFLEFLVEWLKGVDITNIVLCTGHQGEIISRHFGDGRLWGVNIRYSHEEHPLGTAGAVRKAMRFIDSDPFIVLNGDSFIAVDLQDFLRFHQAKKASISIVLSHVSKMDRYGSVVINSDGLILTFTTKRVGYSGLINAGVYLMGRAALFTIPEGRPVSMEHAFLPHYAKLGLYGFESSGPFIDIGVPECYNRAQKLFRNWPHI